MNEATAKIETSEDHPTLVIVVKGGIVNVVYCDKPDQVFDVRVMDLEEPGFCSDEEEREYEQMKEELDTIESGASVWTAIY